MPIIGVSSPYVAKYGYNGVKAEYSEGMRMGRAAAGNVTPSTSESNDKYYDNALGETTGGLFTGGTFSTTLGEIGLNPAKLCFGVKTRAVEVNGVTMQMRVHVDNPKAPYLGYGIIYKLMEYGRVFFMAVVLLKTKMDQPAISGETQGETINYQDTEVSGRIWRSDEADTDGNYPWMLQMETDNEEAADNFIRSTLGMPIGKIGTLSVTSAAGQTAGNTAVTVTPEKGSGNKYMYRIAEGQNLPYFEQSCGEDEGFTAWNGTAEIAATAGATILVVETDATDLAKKAGMTTVRVQAGASPEAQRILAPLNAGTETTTSAATAKSGNK